MSVFKCKMCGGTLEINESQTTAVCDYCGTEQTLPKLDDERRANLYDRANHFRRNNEFDKAMSIYENILNEDSTDAEAYWSLVLCRYGIEYVEDPTTHKRVPTVNRAQFTSIYDDDNYKSAIANADLMQKTIYEAEAAAINEIQKGILAISQKEDPFDVFICYKETDANGRRTQDSVLANDLYYQLTSEGFKVFFSRITLEDKLGVAYEPYIFAALNSAKVMVVLGTKPEYFNAVWVKNEWSRYLTLVKQSGGKKVLIPAYRDMDPYDLPEEFSHLQAQDMSKLGFMQDLIRGIKKLAQTDKPQVIVKETRETVVSGDPTASVAPLLKRVFMYLEDGEWDSANEYCERVLDIEPENVQAYLGKLMADMRTRTRKNLSMCPKPFSSNSNYLKIVKFGDAQLKEELKGYIKTIEERNEQERLSTLYHNGCDLMEKNTPDAYLKAADIFKSIRAYKDSDKKAGECLEKAEITRKDIIYNKAKSLMNGDKEESYTSAIKQFESIIEWRDSKQQIELCKKKIEGIKKAAEEARLAAIKKAEDERLAKERLAAEKKKKLIKTGICIASIVILIVIVVNVANFIKYKPLNDAFDSDELTVEFIRSNYSNLQNDKGALKVFEKQLEKCHKQNDLEQALDIISTLAQSGVIFDYKKYDASGNNGVDLNPHIMAWYSFTTWMCEEASKYGTEISIDNSYRYAEYCDKAYSVYDYKIMFELNNDGEARGAVLYVPSIGWYEVAASAKYFDGGSNIGFHNERGGVMVD